MLCVFGEHNYGDPARGEGYEFTNFIPALKRLGHEVLFVESYNRARYSSFAQLNETLLRTVEEQRPEVVLSVMLLYEIWLDTWEILRDSGLVATVNWTTDDSWKYSQSSRLIAPAFHAFTTTYPDVLPHYHADGIRHVMLTQWAANAADLRPPRRASDCQHQVTFVGSAHGSRMATVQALRSRGIDVECFGYGWPSGPVPGRLIPEIMHDSMISLNFANSTRTWNGLFPKETSQLKARTFEVPGAGGFLLTEWATGLERFYQPDKEVVAYRGIEDLVRKIRYYLNHPSQRDAIAQAGYERTRRDHTYDTRLQAVIEFALQQKAELPKHTGAHETGRVDWDRYRAAAARHAVTGQTKLARRILTGACSLIWGPKRGPRAARRLAFEVSWRLRGAETYRASGWPGRMFYRES